MKKLENFKKYQISKKEIKGGWLGAIGLGLAAMAIAYEVGKDVAKYQKAQ